MHYIFLYRYLCDAHVIFVFSFFYIQFDIFPYGEGSCTKHYMKHQMQFALLHLQISFLLRSKSIPDACPWILQRDREMQRERERQREVAPTTAHAMIRQYIITVTVPMFEIVHGGG